MRHESWTKSEGTRLWTVPPRWIVIRLYEVSLKRVRNALSQLFCSSVSRYSAPALRVWRASAQVAFTPSVNCVVSLSMSNPDPPEKVPVGASMKRLSAWPRSVAGRFLSVRQRPAIDVSSNVRAPRACVPRMAAPIEL